MHFTNYCNYQSNYQVVSTHPLQLALFYFASITSYILEKADSLKDFSSHPQGLCYHLLLGAEQ